MHGLIIAREVEVGLVDLMHLYEPIAGEILHRSGEILPSQAGQLSIWMHFKTRFFRSKRRKRRFNTENILFRSKNL